ncbi:MAG: hypothetical protein II781_05025 [Clostridia bacterium]|nr:hypothetical protein [Clostridia bacterium]
MTEEIRKTESRPAWITDQTRDELSSLPWGKRGDVARNGCGLISVYNLLLMLGNPWKKRDLYRAMTQAHAPLLFGKLGTNPFAILRFLRSLYPTARVRLFPGIGKRITGRYAAIFLYLGWDKGLFAHYVACNLDPERLYLPNDGDARPKDLKSWFRHLKKRACLCIAAVTI